MADWTTNKPVSSYSAGSQINEFITKRTGLINNGKKTIYVKNFGKDSVVGINVKGIPEILRKLRDYRLEILEEINKLNSSMAKADNAIHSDVIREELQNYFVGVRDNLQALISQLNAFGDKLADVTDQYKAFESGQSSSINKFNEQTKSPEHYQMRNTTYGTGTAPSPTVGGHGQGENESSTPQNLQTIQDLDQ